MTVKRWSVGVDGPDENGNLVAYTDYLSLSAENSSLRLTIDNIVNALSLGDGPVSQQVIELVTGLVAENLALLEKSEDVYAAGYNHGHLHTADGIAYASNVEDDFYESALRVIAEIETRNTDAAIAEIRKKAIDEEFNRTPDAEIRWDGTEFTVQNVLDGFSFGVTPVYVNLRAGGKAS